jgi:hypothetical protein
MKNSQTEYLRRMEFEGPMRQSAILSVSIRRERKEDR